MRRVERRDHRFEQMHLRILPPRQRHRQSFVNAAMRRAQLRLDEMAQRVDLGADLRIAIEPVDGCKGQQHEGVVVGIAQRIQHGAIRRQRVDEARACRRAPSPWRADAPAPSARSRGRRDTSPFAPPWRSNRSGAPARKPGAAPGGLHGRRGSSRSIKPPALSSQPSVDHSGRQWSIMRSFSLATISAETAASAAAAVCPSAIASPGT